MGGWGGVVVLPVSWKEIRHPLRTRRLLQILGWVRKAIKAKEEKKHPLQWCGFWLVARHTRSSSWDNRKKKRKRPHRGGKELCQKEDV